MRETTDGSRRRLLKAAVILVAGVAEVEAGPAKIAWVALPEPPENEGFGALLHAKPSTRYGVAKVPKAENRVWRAAGSITIAATSTEEGRFTGVLLEEQVAELPMLKRSELARDAAETVDALDIVKRLERSLLPRPRELPRKQRRAERAVRQARETVADSTLEPAVRDMLDDRFNACQTALEASRDAYSALGRRPTRQQLQTVADLVALAAAPLRDALRLLLSTNA